MAAAWSSWTRTSKLLWKVAANTHHDVVVDEDGSIWVPSMHYRPQGLPEFPHFEPWYYEDTVLHLSPEGAVLGEVSVLKALASWPGLLSLNYREDLEVTSNDLLHINSAEPLPAVSPPASRCSRPATCWSACATSTRWW